MPRDEASLLDIAKAAGLALQFTQDVDRADFMGDASIQASVLYEIVLIGEAAKRLSPEFRELHPHIPWREVAGMRDRIIHQYDRIDLERVWKAVETEIPKLIKDIEPLLPRPR